jgi:hypothetical protein
MEPIPKYRDNIGDNQYVESWFSGIINMVKYQAIYRLFPLYHFRHFLCDFCNFCVHFWTFFIFWVHCFCILYVFNDEDFFCIFSILSVFFYFGVYIFYIFCFRRS